MKKLLAPEEQDLPWVPRGLQHYNPYSIGSHPISSQQKGRYRMFGFQRSPKGELVLTGPWIGVTPDMVVGGDTIVHSDGSMTNYCEMDNGYAAEKHLIPFSKLEELTFLARRSLHRWCQKIYDAAFSKN